MVIFIIYSNFALPDSSHLSTNIYNEEAFIDALVLEIFNLYFDKM